MNLTMSHFGETPTNIGPCLGPYGARKTFYLDGVRLIVPDAVTDKKLRYLVDKGMGLDNAYATVGWKNNLPEQGMRECCRSVLRQKWLDQNREWQLSGWGHTCAGYHGCLERYVLALRETAIRGRMKIAHGLYSPSPTEEACIRQRFALYSDIARAYTECDAGDILPRFAGGIEALNIAMLADRQKTIKQPMYKMIETAFNISTIMPGAPPEHHTPPEHHASPPSPSSYLWIAVAVVGTALILTR